MPLKQIDYLRGLSQLAGLTALESAIAKAWLDAHWQEFDSVDFNVRLGSGVELPPGSPDYIKRFARAATTKRADLVLHLGRDVTIVEVKIRIGGSALGQLQLYSTLYARDFPATQRITMIAAGQTIEPDVRDVLTHHGIRVELFPQVAAA